MDPSNQGAKDPAVGVVLSLFIPGLGHLYAGRFGSFVLFLAGEAWLVMNGYYPVLFAVHAFQAIAAGGAVKHWNMAHAGGPADGVAVPPPPPAGSGRAARPRPTSAPATPKPAPPAAPAVLGPDEFLAEMQAAWRAHRSGEQTAREFADRKWRAVRAVRVEHREDGAALVEAARHLQEAGVMTSEEVGQLASRVEAA